MASNRDEQLPVLPAVSDGAPDDLGHNPRVHGAPRLGDAQWTTGSPHRPGLHRNRALDPASPPGTLVHTGAQSGALTRGLWSGAARWFQDPTGQALIVSAPVGWLALFSPAVGRLVRNRGQACGAEPGRRHERAPSTPPDQTYRRESRGADVMWRL